MSLAEFGFVSLTPGQSARYDWTDTNSESYKNEQRKKKEEKERKERAAREEAARKQAEEDEKKRKEEEEEAARLAEEERKKEEELDKLHQPWWKKYAEKYQGSSGFDMGETTPPPEDDAFPQVFSMTNDNYTTPQSPRLKTAVEKELDQSKPKEPVQKEDLKPKEPVQKEDVKPKEPVQKEEVKPETIPQPSTNTETVPEHVKEPVSEPIPEPKQPQDEIKEPEVATGLPETKPEDIPEPVSEPTANDTAEVGDEMVDQQVNENIPEQEQEKMEEVRADNVTVSEEPKGVKEELSSKVEKEVIQEDLEPTKEPEKPEIQKVSATDKAKTKEEEVKTKPPKKGLSSLSEKVLSKSKVKKVKKKSAAKKASKAPTADDVPNPEEKENHDSSRRQSESDIKMDETKVPSTRKRPLEDIDVEDKVSQGQGKRASDHSNEARGLSTADDVEMMATQSPTVLTPSPPPPSNSQADKDQPMDVVSPPPVQSNDSTDILCMDTTNDETKNGGSHTLPAESEDLTCPDLLKTLKTVKALKKSLLSAFAFAADDKTPTTDNANPSDNIVGAKEQPLAKNHQPEMSQSDSSVSQKVPEVDSCKEITDNQEMHSVPREEDEKQQGIAKEDGDPDQQQHVGQADADSDKENSSFSLGNMSVCSDSSSVVTVIDKREAGGEERATDKAMKEEVENAEVILPNSQQKEAIETSSRLEPEIAAGQGNGQMSVTCQGTNSYILSPPTSVATEAVKTAGFAESTGHSKNASDYGKLDTTQNDLECKQTAMTLGHSKDDLSNRPKIMPTEKNDIISNAKAREKKESDSFSGINHVKHPDEPKEDILSKNRSPTMHHIPSPTNIDQHSRSGSPHHPIGTPRRKKSASLEKAEQWLRERMEQKAKSRKNSLLLNDHNLISESVNVQINSPKAAIPKNIPVTPIEVRQTREKKLSQTDGYLSGATTDPSDFHKKLSKNTPDSTKELSPSPTEAYLGNYGSSPSNNTTTLPSRFRSMWQQSKSHPPPEPPPPPRRGSVFDHSRGSSRSTSIVNSLTTTPTASRATSPVSSGKPQYATSVKTANVISTRNIERAKSVFNFEDEPKNSYKKEQSNASYFDRSKSVHKDDPYKAGSAFMNRHDYNKPPTVSRRESKEEIKSPLSYRRASGKEDYKPPPSASSSRKTSREDAKGSKDLSPVILVRPSTFIQAQKISTEQQPGDSIKKIKPPEISPDKQQDRIPSRFRKGNHHAAQGSGGMNRAKSIHELNEASLGQKTTILQDQIRQARADHMKIFDDAQSHTHYTTRHDTRHQREGSRSRFDTDWLNRATTTSMRSLRSSPAMDYRRL